ncbi:MAG TPA: outer membrane beta-barrel protein [Rhodothermales bacterium]|nr:outer membrane beta-barrel protein [Rhodothermales bacterium]
MKKYTTTLLALFFLALGIQTASAQIGIRIGPRVGYEIDDLNEVFIGADARLDILTLPVIINPAFDYYLTDGGDLFQLSANALYTFGINNTLFTPYAGAGVGITRFSSDVSDFSDTNVGLNIVGGAEFGFGGLRPFVQAQLTLDGESDLTTIAGGLLFNIGG